MFFVRYERDYLYWPEVISVLIRWAKEKDFDSWCDLANEVSQIFRHPNDMGQGPEFRSYAQSKLIKYEAITAVDYISGKNMGFIGFSRTYNRISWFGIFENHRNKGVGSRLLKTALRQLDSKKPITVETYPEGYELEVTGKASIHGIDGVEIIAHENRGGEHEGNLESRNLTRTFVAQLTDTHCRILAESHYDGDVKRFYTFLDADEFLPNWGFGEDNCGNEINLSPKGLIKRDGSIVFIGVSIVTTGILIIMDSFGMKSYLITSN